MSWVTLNFLIVELSGNVPVLPRKSKFPEHVGGPENNA